MVQCPSQKSGLDPRLVKAADEACGVSLLRAVAGGGAITAGSRSRVPVTCPSLRGWPAWPAWPAGSSGGRLGSGGSPAGPQGCRLCPPPPLNSMFSPLTSHTTPPSAKGCDIDSTAMSMITCRFTCRFRLKSGPEIEMESTFDVEST